MSSGKPHLGLEGVWSKRVAFILRRLKEAAAAGDFDTDQSKTDTPTLTLNTEIVPDTLKWGFIKRVHYRLNPVNAVTYTLRLWSKAVAADYESNMNMLYETPAGRTDDEDYDDAELDIPFVLGAEGTMYYSIDWSGATGNIQGFIGVSGETSEH